MSIPQQTRLLIYMWLQVMVQKHNRQISFSLYICVLAITDTIPLLIGRYNCILQCTVYSTNYRGKKET